MNKTKRILYYATESDAYMYSWQRTHFFDELQRNKVYIELFNPLAYNNHEEAQSKLLDYLKKSESKFDLFFTGLGDKMLSKEFVAEIKNIGLFTLLICYDNLHAPFNHQQIAANFDLVWLTSKETEYLFHSWGAKTIFMPYAANPYFYKPSESKEIKTIGFIGNPYGGRIRKINFLTENNFHVSLYSNQSKSVECDQRNGKRNLKQKILHSSQLLNFQIGRQLLVAEIKAFLNNNPEYFRLIQSSNLSLYPQVSFEMMNELLSSFAISLNIIEIRNSFLLRNPILKLHLRTFEIPMSGGLQIVNYTDEIASYFEDEKEIILYKTKEEMIKKAAFYLRDDQRHNRSKMKIAARKRALSDHTWIHRFSKIFEQSGI